MKNIRTAIVTGAAGFIGFFVSQKLLAEGWRVIGVDSMSDYYDVSLKERRESTLFQAKLYRSRHAKVEDPGLLMSLFEEERPDVVIHLAAQAGVRNSIENPRDYLQSNVVGTFELLEAARAFPPHHTLLASTSSAYGANKEMPYRESDRSDHPMSFYAATKKSTENIAHSYSHLFGFPVTMFRFFTVYGPWGRPDMALFKFTKAILEQKPIEVYNYGDMKRSFTYIDDLVRAIILLIDQVPQNSSQNSLLDSISPVAPFRVVNIGNPDTISLSEFITSIEEAIGAKAEKKFLPMQPGDIPETLASTELLKSLINFIPQTDIQSGVNAFVDWYRKYYQV